MAARFYVMLFISYTSWLKELARVNNGSLHFAMPTNLQCVEIKNLFISIEFDFPTAFLFTEIVSSRDRV